VDAISVTADAGVFHVEFRSPVLGTRVLRELAYRLELLAGSHPTRAVVLASAHPSIFLAGADLGEISELDADASVEYARLGRHAMATIRRHPSPTVAAVNGSCSGGGFDLVLSCDAVVAHPRATFSHPGVIRGLVTGWSGSLRLPEALGRPAARGALLEGRPVSATELLDAGVVHLVSDDLWSTAADTARHLAAIHPRRLQLWRTIRGSSTGARFRGCLLQGIIK